MNIDTLWVDLRRPTLATPEVVVQTGPLLPAEYTRTLAGLMGAHHLDNFWLAMHACAHRDAAPWLSICVEVEGVDHDLTIVFEHGVPTSEALAERSALTYAVHAAGGALSLVMHEVRAAVDQVDRLRMMAVLMAHDAARLTRRQRMYVLLKSQARAGAASSWSRSQRMHALLRSQAGRTADPACAQLAELVYTGSRRAIREAVERVDGAVRRDVQEVVTNLLDDGPLDRVPTRTRAAGGVWTST